MATGLTLQEVEQKKPDGFFPKLYTNVCKAMKDEHLEQMDKLKEDNVGMIRFAYNLEPFKNALEIKEFYPEKNPHECKIKKEYGNKAYQDGRDIDALHYYTQAVISAPVDEATGKSKELSVALANRSAVLFSLKAYHLALDDVKLAMDCGYPEELTFKLLERKAKILMFFKQFESAHECYKQLLKSLDVAKADQAKKLKVQKDAQQALAYFKKAPSIYNDPNVPMKPELELPKLPDKNKKYPAISNAITFKYEPGRGRYAVATRDIKVGEFVCVEEPIVSHPLPEYLGSNCAHCFKGMKAPQPCPVCSKVMFCSYDCRKVALSTYHPYECKVIDYLIASGMSIVCFLAYKAIVKKPLSFFLENRAKFEQHDESSGSTNNQNSQYKSQDYRNYFNLVTHHSERKVGDIFHRAMLTVMLLRCMKKFGYFGPDANDDVVTDDECYVGSILSHFLEVNQFNAHEVAQFEMIARNKEEGSKSVYIGAACYPTLAMFNHSCDPSIIRFYIEDYVCVQTIKNIRKGEEICENYGPIFFHSAKDDRQSRLKTQYWFDCNCIPCQENWPLMHEMTDDVLNFRCPGCSGAVPFETASNNPMLKCSCGTPVPILKAAQAISCTEIVLNKAESAMEDGDFGLAQQTYHEYLSILDQHMVPPYKDYYKVQQAIWKCVWLQFGNRVIRRMMPISIDDHMAIVD